MGALGLMIGGMKTKKINPFVGFIISILIIIAFLFLAQYLWNEILVTKIIPNSGIKKIDNIIDLLGLAILIQILT
tara:strand:- start:288 stop:512 length:225 start_codon:yes stop_codon:yes gene_type:complete